MRVSYNGHYVAFPRLRRGSDSRHPHQSIRNLFVSDTIETKMTIPKQYLHDRVILLIASVNAFLALILCISTLIRLDTSHSSYIIQYRANLAVDAFKSGSSSELYGFVVFGLLVCAFHLLISVRVYRIHRQLAVTVLGMGTLLLVVSVIVSNALLILR